MHSRYIEGCCAGKLWYNLGEVHGYDVANTLEEFCSEMNKKGLATLNLAIINGYQKTVKKYLEAQGWNMVKQGSLYSCSITGPDLRRAINKILREKLLERARALELLTTPPEKTSLEDITAIVILHTDIQTTTSVEIENVKKIKASLEKLYQIDLTDYFNLEKIPSNFKRMLIQTQTLHSSIVQRRRHAVSKRLPRKTKNDSAEQY